MRLPETHWRLERNYSIPSFQVYGYSMGFGRADHTKAVAELKKVYQDYEIEWSNEGY